MLPKTTHFNPASSRSCSEACQHNANPLLFGVSFFDGAGATEISPTHLGFSEEKYFHEQNEENRLPGPLINSGTERHVFPLSTFQNNISRGISERYWFTCKRLRLEPCKRTEWQRWKNNASRSKHRPFLIKLIKRNESRFPLWDTRRVPFTAQELILIYCCKPERQNSTSNPFQVVTRDFSTKLPTQATNSDQILLITSLFSIHYVDH